MAKDSKHNSSMKRRVASVRRTMERLASKYMPEIDLIEVGKMTENERREAMLGYIDRHITLPKLFSRENDLDAIAKFHLNFQKIDLENQSKKQQHEVFDKILADLKGSSLDTTHTFWYFQKEIWDGALSASPRPRKDCPLNDLDALGSMAASERNAALWLRETSRCAIGLYMNDAKTFRPLFPEIEGDISILNTSFITFVINTPYRHIAADMLVTAASEVYLHLPNLTPELEQFKQDLDMESMRYESMHYNPETVILRDLSIISNAVANLGLREAWSEKGVRG